MATPRLIKLPTVISKTAKSRSSIYDDVRNGSFPAPIHLGPRSVAWDESEVDAWIDARLKEPRKLARTPR